MNVSFPQTQPAVFFLCALSACALAFCAGLVATPNLLHRPPLPSAFSGSASTTAQSLPTADQQKMTPSDRAITQNIRKAIHRDKSLSHAGRNIKIVAQDGKITLRGPVRSEMERINLEAKAANVVGQENVTNQLEIAPSR